METVVSRDQHRISGRRHVADVKDGDEPATLQSLRRAANGNFHRKKKMFVSNSGIPRKSQILVKMTIHDDQPFKNWGQTQHIQVTGGQCGIDLEGKCAGKPDQFGCQNEKH